MTIAICESSITPFHMENGQSSSTPVLSWLPPHTPASHCSSAGPGHLHSWSKIQSLIPSAAAVPYIRSRASMSQMILEMCTESLGSETGSNYLDHQWFSVLSPYVAEDTIDQQEDFSEVRNVRREQLSVNYHCTGRRSTTCSFPTPLRSISRRDGPCFQMRSHRCDGRLIVEAVTVSSRNYIHAHHHEGRLVLSFIETMSSHQSSSTDIVSNKPQVQDQYAYCEPEDKNDEEVENIHEEEVVEVVDRTERAENFNDCQ